MVVAVSPVGVVQVAPDEEVDVVAVRHALMPTPALVGVALSVFGALMRRRTNVWIRRTRSDVVLVDMSIMDVVKMAVVKVVGVSSMSDRSVPASIPVCVLMSGVLTASHGTPSVALGVPPSQP